MEKGLSLSKANKSKANKGMHRLFSGSSFAVLVAPILLSMLVFNHLKKKKRSAEKDALSIPLKPTGEGSNRYDVFLSFRGSDIHKGFTDHLYNSLVNLGTVTFCVFRDDNSIPTDKESGSQFLDAISSSKISIPIISENYASNKWCLYELTHIMKCKKSMSHIVLPIFYKVDPLDVRYLKGNFGEAFHSHKKHFDEKDIQEGQRTLEEVSYLNGWKFEESAIRNEREMIKLVIETVLSELHKDFEPHIPEELVGRDGHVKEIANWINTPSVTARMIGIYGVGGIGKTTLAKCIYNQLLNRFVHVSFLPDIQETTRHHNIEDLQSRLLYDILQSKIPVATVDEGINIMRARFKGKKVLILLDDIDDVHHLDALVGERNQFASGSIIIVTSRKGFFLGPFEPQVDYEIELNNMNVADSLILLNRHAFHMNHPPRDFEGISRHIVDVVDGIPLALEIVGLCLYAETDRRVWVAMLKHLESVPYFRIQEKLKISYDVFAAGDKGIFLDIACFFIGEKSKFAIYMWDDCGFYTRKGIEELKLRSLIKIEEDGTLGMYDQLRDLGRNIIYQEGLPEKRSRLWVYEEASEVLTEKKGTESIEAICLDNYYGYHRTYTDEQFEKLPRLRFLRLRNGTLSGDFKNLFSELRWLQWFGIEPGPSFSATNLHLSKLVVLQLSRSQITEDWRGWSSFKAAKRLKVLDLAFCEYLSCTPDLLAFTELEILILKDCYILERIHHSIGQVKSLVSLDLSGCSSLEELPGEVGQLEELKELILDSAGITKIPKSIGSLKKLEKLSARTCRSLREISSSICDLPNLQHLDISGCLIEKLPSDIRRLKKPNHLALPKLKILILKDCYRLKQVHSSIGKFKSLVSLDLSGCSNLKELPGEVGELEELKELILDFAGITKIPTSISSLRKLEKLSARTCRSLREIPSSIWDLQNLQHLDFSECSIEKLPDAIGRLKKPNLSTFTKLEILILKDCYTLKQVHPYIGKVKSLIFLDLSGCGRLKELPREVGELEELKEIFLDSAGITKIPTSIGSLRKLEKLSAQACLSLTEVPSSIGDLQNLRHLDFSESPIKRLSPAIGRLKKLERLSLKSCHSLEGEIPSEIGDLSSLEILEITRASISGLPQSIQNLSSLQHLNLWGCYKLRSLPELPSNLKYLRVSCQSPMLPQLSRLIHLKKLELSWVRST